MRGSGGTCLQGGRTPTVPEEGGCAGEGAAPGQAGRCRGAEHPESRTAAGGSGPEESGCSLAAAGSPSLSGC